MVTGVAPGGLLQLLGQRFLRLELLREQRIVVVQFFSDVGLGNALRDRAVPAKARNVALFLESGRRVRQVPNEGVVVL